jgi:hypothetical protein
MSSTWRGFGAAILASASGCCSIRLWQPKLTPPVSSTRGCLPDSTIQATAAMLTSFAQERAETIRLVLHPHRGRPLTGEIAAVLEGARSPAQRDGRGRGARKALRTRNAGRRDDAVGDLLSAQYREEDAAKIGHGTEARVSGTAPPTELRRRDYSRRVPPRPLLDDMLAPAPLRPDRGIARGGPLHVRRAPSPRQCILRRNPCPVGPGDFNIEAEREGTWARAARAMHAEALGAEQGRARPRPQGCLVLIEIVVDREVPRARAY